MGIINKIKKLKDNEEFRKILKYILRPGIKTLFCSIISVLIFILIALISKKLESVIVDYDISYNSFVFIALGWIFVTVAVGSLLCGIVFSLKKYIRPGGTGIFNKVYKNGNSYKALNNIMNKE